MASYALGYDEQQPGAFLLGEQADGLIHINLLAFIAKPTERECVAAWQAFLGDFEQRHLSAQDILITSFESVNTDIRAALSRGHHFSGQDYERINRLLCVFISHFRLKPHHKTKDFLKNNALPTQQWAPKFYGRYGNVELRVLENWLKNPEQLNQELVSISRQLDNENAMYQDGKRPHWLSAADAHFNLRRLMTNAGFYFSDSAPSTDTASLEQWASRYFQALAELDYLFPYPSSYPNFWVIQDTLFRTQGVLKDYTLFPGPEKFYAMLAGQNVLFMTAFAEEIAGLYDSRKLFKLYTDINIPDFRLSTVPAFISTYPNRPHDSWRETFGRLTTEVDRAFAQQAFTLFFASCGCYGLPICHYVHQRYGCASVYYGNFTNTLFGVLQNCSQEFLRPRRIGQNWSIGNLQQFKNVAKIDSGRYL